MILTFPQSSNLPQPHTVKKFHTETRQTGAGRGKTNNRYLKSDLIYLKDSQIFQHKYEGFSEENNLSEMLTLLYFLVILHKKTKYI